jgi:hypothetical protein
LSPLSFSSLTKLTSDARSPPQPCTGICRSYLVRVRARARVRVRVGVRARARVRGWG